MAYNIKVYGVNQMKKIGLVLILALIIPVCSACSLNLTINTDSNSENESEVVEKKEISTEIPHQESAEKHTTTPASSSNESEAFYGVWCSGSKSKPDAENSASELVAIGFDAHVFVTTDWANLNPEKFYVVTAGICGTKQEAEQLLSVVKRSGYSDAYVKYTGERK